MKRFPIQSSFSLGEISERLYARTDSEAYKAGLSHCENFVCLRHGPVQRRFGMVYKTTIPGDYARIFTFQKSSIDYTVIIISDDGNIYAWDRDGSSFVATSTHDYDAGDIQALQAKQAPSSVAMYFVVSNHQPYKLEYTGGDVWTWNPVNFNGTPPVWGVGNYPNTVAFYQRRSWWAGCPQDPETFWASRLGAYEDLTPGENTDDGLEWSIHKKGAIQWMESSKNLLIGTTTGEYVVTSSGAAVTSNDRDVQQQSANGSRLAHALALGIEMFYISGDGWKVRTLNYQWTEAGWSSRDISFGSAQFGQDNILTHMNLARDPEMVVWINTATGVLIGVTYEPDINVIGWHQHTQPNGRYMSTCTPTFNGTTEKWHIIEREIDGSTVLYLEKDSDSVYMDSARAYVVQPDTDQVLMPHLPNQLVQVMVDGAVHPDVQLDENGTGTLRWRGSQITAGLGYQSTMRTLPADAVSRSGSGMGIEKNLNRIFVRCKDSAAPLIQGQRPSERTSDTPMNERQPIIDGVTDFETRSGGWSRERLITIEQDLPLPLTVLGIFGEEAQGVIS